jgi:two-component system phosphate regulon sensor histidine kinase PhoR
MVTQVIEVSAIISDQLNLAIEPTDVAKLLAEKVEEWYPIAANRGLILSLFPCNNLWINGDYERLGQVLDHVLQNSYNYTLPGGFIEVSADRHNDRISISVFDSGVGIDSDDLDNVFERMYRGKSADAGPTDSRGLGLGLYMTKQIIEAHRGTIALESKPGAGTMVTIDLPAVRQQSAIATQEAAR